VGRYHRSRASREKVTAFFERFGSQVTCLEMAQWLGEKVGSPGHHNPHASSLMVEKTLGLAK
jgi:hypothetical protein